MHAKHSPLVWGDQWMRLLLVVILGAALAINARVAAAEDRPECFSKFAKFNVCEKAREAHSGLAAMLPMKMNANITLSTAIAQGPRVIITAIWNIDKSEFDARLQANNIDGGRPDLEDGRCDQELRLQLGCHGRICQVERPSSVSLPNAGRLYRSVASCCCLLIGTP
jgi:hypothetical protein